MLTEVTMRVTALCAANLQYERSGDPSAFQEVLATARQAHAGLRTAMDQLTVPMGIRDELAALDAHVLRLVRLLESMALWPEISRAAALMGCSMDLRTLNSAMRQLVESCTTARNFEELEVLLVVIAALLYALRSAASRREELLVPAMDFSSLCAVSRAHLAVLAELALGELRLRSDARFSIEQWRDDAAPGGPQRFGYSFDDRRYAVRPDTAQRHGYDERSVARSAMCLHRDRSFEELPGTQQIRHLLQSTGVEPRRRGSIAAA